MKKRIIALFIFLLVFSAIFVCAQNKENKDINQTEKVESILNKEVIFPGWSQDIVRYLFGLTGPIPLQQVIVLLGAFVGLLMIILDITSILPFFDIGWIKFVAALVITMILSATGAVNRVAIFFLDIAGFFKFTAEFQPIKLILAFTLVLFLLYGVHFLIKTINKKIVLGKAEQVGEDLSRGKGIAKIFSKAGRKINEKK